MTNYDELFSLNGKTALITGGTGGLGSAVALSFLQKGARSCMQQPSGKSGPCCRLCQKAQQALPFSRL